MTEPKKGGRSIRVKILRPEARLDVQIWMLGRTNFAGRFSSAQRTQPQQKNQKYKTRKQKCKTNKSALPIRRVRWPRAENTTHTLTPYPPRAVDSRPAALDDFHICSISPCRHRLLPATGSNKNP